MSDTALTDKQQLIYAYIRKTIETKGFPPAIRDICEAFGISSPNGVMCHLKALEKKGLLTRELHSARAITLVDHRPPSQGLP